MRAAVIGGGISGLAAAWELRDEAEVTIFEPGDIGGRLSTGTFEGRRVERGPDAFITRSPAATILCAELGIDDLIAPQVGQTLLWWDGRLRRLPDGLVLGAPKRLLPLVTSGLLSPTGLARAAADLVLPRRPLRADLSVRDLVAGRFGPQVADRLVDPLVGGIHAGRTAELSAATTVPQLLEAARSSRSLLVGLRRLSAATGGPVQFLTPRDGLGSLVEHLAQRLAGAGVSFESEAVSSVFQDGRNWRVDPCGDAFDAVVVATSAATANSILGARAPSGLSRITSASVALVNLGYPAVDLPPEINGALVPAGSGCLMSACSFASAKWPHWANPGRTVFRVSAGRDGDRRAFEIDDDALVGRLGEEMKTVLGLSQSPDSWQVNRWADSFPQYRVGHATLVQGITEDLRRSHPNITVCGSSYHGAGIPACISSGRAAARSLMTAIKEQC